MQKDFTIPPLEPGVYEHYKGNTYQVLGVGCHTETHEYFVVYTSIKQQEGTPKIWLRPYDMFMETVEVEGQVIPRFKHIAG